ncbi:MAG TPA: PEP/pyruvate-binding domain-containing protein [Propionibacteriaceae bacterium]|nr:PEP/pyruvate-binding domain-containing protein [Propionibacteriaceae bacterium]
MSLLVDFVDIGPGMIDAVGGKALNLGVLCRAGLPVPTGYCLTTTAYRSVVGDQLNDLHDRLVSADPEVLARAAAEARDRVRAIPVPSELRERILERYHTMPEGSPVAVRSSATAEDLAYASFAGQQDTYLNVIGDDALIEAIQGCWASLWTDRAVSYRTANGIDPRSVALAVVVQQMVEATAAGVMFTANPLTGTRHQTVIDASSGLGEAVVSGAVNPDHYVVDTKAWSIVQRRPGDKRVVIRGRSGGGTERVEQTDQSEATALSDAQVLALARLGARVAEHYGSPQDTEWALAGDGAFWLTQARPITTLYPTPTSALPGDRLFMCLTLAQGLTRPITPMGLASFRLVGTSIATAAGAAPADRRAGPSGLTTAGQRLFVDITPVVRSGFGRRLMLTVFGVMEARAAAVIAGLAEDPRWSVTSHSPLGVIGPIARVAVLRAKAPLRILTAVVNPGLAPRAIDRVERRLRGSLTLPANASPAQRLDLVEARLGHDTFLLMPTVFSYAATGLLLLRLARRLLGDLARPEELQVVLRGLPHNVTTEMDLELWQVATQIRADEDAVRALADQPPTAVAQAYRDRTLPPVAQRGITAFLRRYGHRAVAEIDLGVARWSEEPSHIIGMIANYLRLTDPEQAPPVQFRRGRQAAEAMITELTGRASRRNRVTGRLIGFALGRARRLIGLRESPKYLLIVALAALRNHLLQVGRVLAEQGSLAAAEDIFFLDYAEARRALDGERFTELVIERREAYAVEMRRRHVPRLLMSDGTEPEAVAIPAPRTDGALAGSPASAGTVTGPARVVLDPVGAHLEPGEILVAPSTDPGWTPLFLTAGGLVMEMGGSNSHGAVVAREYGIPAVVGVPSATSRIETGQLITVDGASGLVTVG